MSHLLYLMFRCDFDVMESLEDLAEVNTAFFEMRLLSFQLPSSNTNEKFAEACVLINSNTRFDVLRQ